MHRIQKFSIRFNFDLPADKVKWLKKPFSAAIRELSRADLAEINTELFFNRDEETGKSENRYPLIQYQSINGKAAITGINEGAEALQLLFQVLDKRENHAFCIKHLITEQNRISLRDYNKAQFTAHDISLLRSKRDYIVKDWLPLDSHRYKNWAADGSLGLLTEILDECLPRQISRMLEAVGLTRRMAFLADCSMILATKPLVQVYREKKLPFDCVIRTNLDLPTDIGIGQVPGIGYGRVLPFNTKQYL